MPEGTIEGNLQVSLPKATASNPFELIQKVQGKAKLKVPVVVVRKVLTQSIQQRLATPQQQQAQTIQQGLVQQMQNQPANSTTQAAAPATSGTNQADLEQQAAAQADTQLATMIQNGVLTLNGSDYSIEMSFDKGQLTVNGKPFDQRMMKPQ
jgi:uncharacterized protein YdgA (DUF945 family)